MSARIGNLMVVPEAGRVISAPEEVPRTLNAIAVIPRPDRSVKTLPEDVMRALGKRKSAGPLKEAGSSPLATACAWLVAEGITDLLIYDSEWLGDRDVHVLLHLAEATRVWLLFDGPANEQLYETFSTSTLQTVSPASLDFWMNREAKPAGEHWRRFPRVPLSSALTFRGQCEKQFDAVELSRIDDLLDVGVEKALEYFRDGVPDPDDLLNLVISPTLPLWPALCQLRGIQLGATWSGHRVEVDLSAWLEFKRNRPELSQAVCENLLEQADPRDAVLLTAAAVSNAHAVEIAELNVGDVDPDFRKLSICGESYAIPEALKPAVQAYVRLRHSESRTFDPLLLDANGNRITVARVRDVCQQAAARAGFEFVIDGRRERGRRSKRLAQASHMLTVTRIGGAIVSVN